MKKTFLLLFISFFIPLSKLIAQDWEVEVFEEFNSALPNLSQVPNLYQQGFIGSGFGGSGNTNDYCALSKNFIGAAHIAFQVTLSADKEYQVSYVGKRQGNSPRYLQFKYNDSYQLTSAIDIGDPQQINTLPTTGPGDVLTSDVFSGLDGTYYLFAAVGQGSQTSFNNVNVRLDDFILKSRPLPAYSFSTSGVQIEEGGSLEVCVELTSASEENTIEVQVELDGAASPHFDDFIPQTLVFTQGETNKCFELTTDSDNGIEDDNFIYSLVCESQNSSVVQGEQTNLTITVQEGVNCSFAGLDQTICEGECITIGCMPEEGAENYCYKWIPNDGMEEGEDVLSQPLVCPESTTTYTVYVTDDQGNLIAEDNVTVVVQNIELSIYPDNPYICPGAECTLEATTSGEDLFDYMWSTGETTYSINVTEAGSYSVTVTNQQTGCSEEFQKSVTEVENPVTVSINSDVTSICEGVTATLQAIPSIQEGQFSFEWSNYQTGPSIEVNESGEYHVTLTDEALGCENIAVINLVEEELTVSIEQEALIICDGLPVNIEVAQGFSNYQWEGPSNFVIEGTDEYSISAPEAGIYSVTVTAENGCLATAEAELGDTENTGAIRTFFEERGFYSLPITILGPEGFTSPTEEMRVTTLCDQEICNDGDNFCVRDDAQLNISIQGDEINSLEASLTNYLEYFESEFGYQNIRAYVTSNENICECPDYLEIIEQKFESADLAFWIHLYETENEGVDEMLILSNVPTSSNHWPGPTQNRQSFLDGALSYIYSEPSIGDFASKGEQVLFAPLDLLLDNHVGMNLFPEEDPVEGGGVLCENYIIDNAIGLAPSGIPMTIPPNSILRFGVEEYWQPYIPSGALVGFTTISDTEYSRYYNGRLEMEFPSGVGQFLGYYQIDRMGAYLDESPYLALNSSFENVTLGFQEVSDVSGSLFYNIQTREYLCINLEILTNGSGDVVSDFDNCIGNLIDETQYSIDLPPISEAVFNSETNSFSVNWENGILISIPQENGYVDYVYGTLNTDTAEEDDFIFYRWFCATGEWIPFEPDDNSFVNQVGFEYTAGGNSSNDEDANPNSLGAPECFEVRADQINNVFAQTDYLTINSETEHPDIQDFAGIPSSEKDKIISAIEIGQSRWSVNLKFVISADDQEGIEVPFNSTGEAYDAFHNYDLSSEGTDVLYWMHFRKDGSAGFCIKINESFFETNDPLINQNPEFLEEQLEIKSVLLDGLRKAIGATQESLADSNPADDGPLAQDPPSTIENEKPWYNGIREGQMEDVNLYSVGKEIWGISKQTIKQLEIPDVVWKHDSDCMFNTIGPVIGAGNVIIGENPLVGLAQGVSLGISVVKDQETRDALGQIIRSPLQTAKGYFKQKYETYFLLSDGIEGRNTEMVVDGVSIIVALLTGSALTKLEDFIRSLSENAKEITESLKKKLDDFPEDVQNDFYGELASFGDDVDLNREFAEFMGSVGEEHLTKFIKNPQLARVWKKFKDNNIDLDELDLSNTLKKFPENNPEFYDKLFDTFIDGDGVVSDRMEEFFKDVSGNDDLINTFKNVPNGPKRITAWDRIKELKPESPLSKDIEAIKVIGRQLDDSDFLAKIGGPDNYDQILKNYAGQCNTCDPPNPGATESVKHLPPHNKLLDDFEDFTNNHFDRDGFSAVVNDMKSTDPRKQKGAEFVSRILKNSDDIEAFEYQYVSGQNNTADWINLQGKKIDGKSWSVKNSINNIGSWDFSNQLKQYFSNPPFELWFDYERFQKSDISTYQNMSIDDAELHIKKQYQKLFMKVDKAQELYDAMGQDLFMNQFGVENIQDFINMVTTNLNHPNLYGNFKVK